MICQTVKTGTECSFMTKKGCGYSGGQCKAIVEKCEGCSRIFEWENGRYCRMYADPPGRWILGTCPSATHVKIEVRETAQKINPLKASKRAARAKKK